MAWHLSIWPAPWGKTTERTSIVDRAFFWLVLALVLPFALVAAVVSKVFGLKSHKTRAEVLAAIDDFANGQGGPWDWDDFISMPIADPELEEVRQRCLSLQEDYPADGMYCSHEGFQALRDIAAGLRRSRRSD